MCVCVWGGCFGIMPVFDCLPVCSVFYIAYTCMCVRVCSFLSTSSHPVNLTPGFDPLYIGRWIAIPLIDGSAFIVTSL